MLDSFLIRDRKKKQLMYSAAWIILISLFNLIFSSVCGFDLLPSLILCLKFPVIYWRATDANISRNHRFLGFKSSL
jgi:hypothetical protein